MAKASNYFSSLSFGFQRIFSINWPSVVLFHIGPWSIEHKGSFKYYAIIYIERGVMQNNIFIALKNFDDDGHCSEFTVEWICKKKLSFCILLRNFLLTQLWSIPNNYFSKKIRIIKKFLWRKEAETLQFSLLQKTL